MPEARFRAAGRVNAGHSGRGLERPGLAAMIGPPGHRDVSEAYCNPPRCLAFPLAQALEPGQHLDRPFDRGSRQAYCRSVWKLAAPEAEAWPDSQLRAEA